MNREKIKSTLLEALEKAGPILAESLHERKIKAHKGELNLVTATDEAAEKAILKTIQRQFPDHAILAEESPASGNSPSRWIIDPLDGTTNFAHTFPVACIAIGYEENGRMQVGGVLDPFRNELFFAERGKGAFLNGKPIHVSPTTQLKDALLCTGFPYDRRKDPDLYLSIFKDFMMKAQGMRRTGAAALDLCYVACGRFDGFWEVKLQPWDCAASSLMIEEAGGKLSDFSGNAFYPGFIQTVASNGFIHPEMLEVLKPHRQACLS